MKLSEQELQRYHRQMMLNGWGAETQEKLKDATAFIAGCVFEVAQVVVQAAAARPHGQVR